MRRLALFLVVMTFAGAGVSYAETESPVQSFFAGGVDLSLSGFNEAVLFLNGRDGRDGLPGQDGQDGLPGQDGQDGAPGKNVQVRLLAAGDVNCPNGGVELTDASSQVSFACNGAPGQRATVEIKRLAVGDANCPNGGVQLTDGSNQPSFACNGARGANGEGGARGEQGPPGTSSSVTNIDGTGKISLGACDDELTVRFRPLFVSSGFVLRNIEMKDLNSLCNNRHIRIFFPITETPPAIGGHPGVPNPRPYSYAPGAGRSYIECETRSRLSDLSGSANSILLATDTPTVAGARLLDCSVRSTGAAIQFYELYTADVDRNIGFEIAQ